MSSRVDGLIRLEDRERILSKEECEAFAQRIKSFAQGGGTTDVTIKSWWGGELRWARNRVSLAGDRRDVHVAVRRDIQGAGGFAETNQIDDESLEATVRAAERAALFTLRWPEELEKPAPLFEYTKAAIWSDATYNQTAPERGQVARALISPAEAQDMLSAGFLEVRTATVARFPSERTRPALYFASSRAQCSMTVRDRKGTGSGWAGLSSYDWKAIDAPALAQRALEKALASRNPVALEPGRYTVILEPQAVRDLVDLFMMPGLKRFDAEHGIGPFTAGSDNALGIYRTKLGLKVVDERITISHDPADPLLGVVPVDEGNEYGEPYRPETWIERGVLTALFDDRRIEVLRTRNENRTSQMRQSFRMSGGETTVEEMIKTTKRGILVTRFSGIGLLDPNSLLSTGLTRDGLWLIENGKISKAVKNLRFTESPLFVLNSLEQLGPPVPVFNPDGPVIVPPLKARDFSFTSMVDAV
jgi:predicted Zn-dependent protease